MIAAVEWPCSSRRNWRGCRQFGVFFGAMHEMAVHSKAIIRAYYQRDPRLSYLQGCSTGDGRADPEPAPENTIDYYEAVQKMLGGRQDDWMRLFLMPGVGHCGGSVGPDQADFLGALEQWREDDVAPAQIIATRPANSCGEAPMSRPLCPFPQVARYGGSGSTDDATNFKCVAP
jgi:hypothetical protein